jgi:mannose-6-phosphate isomerase-like protein (cupin superfamily)
MIMVNRQMPDAVSVIDNRHVHRFDQHYYVTEGTMQLDIALDRYEVGPHMLAIVPAGVPHCNRMIGSVPESHIIINVPAPLPAAAGGKEVAKYLATKVIFEAAPKDR